MFPVATDAKKILDISEYNGLNIAVYHLENIYREIKIKDWGWLHGLQTSVLLKI